VDFGGSLQEAEVLEAWASACSKSGAENGAGNSIPVGLERAARRELCLCILSLLEGMLGPDAGASHAGGGADKMSSVGTAEHHAAPHRLSCLVFGRGYLKSKPKAETGAEAGLQPEEQEEAAQD